MKTDLTISQDACELQFDRWTETKPLRYFVAVQLMAIVALAFVVRTSEPSGTAAKPAPVVATSGTEAAQSPQSQPRR